MEFLKSIVLILNVISAVSVIVLVLMQHGKGADMGAAFGSGSAGSLFGSAGSANFLSRATAIGATVFFASCLGLTLVNSSSHDSLDLASAAPAVTASAVAASAVPAQTASPVQNKLPN